jgi:hypothetical protein
VPGERAAREERRAERRGREAAAEAEGAGEAREMGAQVARVGARPPRRTRPRRDDLIVDRVVRRRHDVPVVARDDERAALGAEPLGRGGLVEDAPQRGREGRRVVGHQEMPAGLGVEPFGADRRRNRRAPHGEGLQHLAAHPRSEAHRGDHRGGRREVRPHVGHAPQHLDAAGGRQGADRGRRLVADDADARRAPEPREDVAQQMDDRVDVRRMHEVADEEYVGRRGRRHGARTIVPGVDADRAHRHAQVGQEAAQAGRVLWRHHDDVMRAAKRAELPVEIVQVPRERHHAGADAAPAGTPGARVGREEDLVRRQDRGDDRGVDQLRQLRVLELQDVVPPGGEARRQRRPVGGIGVVPAHRPRQQRERIVGGPGRLRHAVHRDEPRRQLRLVDAGVVRVDEAEELDLVPGREPRQECPEALTSRRHPTPWDVWRHPEEPMSHRGRRTIACRSAPRNRGARRRAPR